MTQEEIFLDISKFAANTRYFSPALKNETGNWIIDMPKVLQYIRDNFELKFKGDDTQAAVR